MHLEGLKYLNVRMLQTLSATDFRLTYRTLQRLTLQAGSPSKVHKENSFETEDDREGKSLLTFWGCMKKEHLSRSVPQARKKFCRFMTGTSLI